MKKVSLFTLVLLLASGLTARAWDLQGSFYAGGIMIPLEITGVEDIAVSDWQNYGLGTLEGRVFIPLSKGGATGQHPALILGYDYPFASELSGVVELQGTQVNQTIFGDIMAGLKWRFFMEERFSLAVVPKVGYAIGTVDFG